MLPQYEQTGNSTTLFGQLLDATRMGGRTEQATLPILMGQPAHYKTAARDRIHLVMKRHSPGPEPVCS